MAARKNLKQRILALLADPSLTYAEIAAQVGCSRENVSGVARRFGRSAAQEISDRHLARQDRARELLRAGHSINAVAISTKLSWCVVRAIRAGAPTSSVVRVPAWAHAAGLRDDFLDTARTAGERAAARHCRRLLAEACHVG